MKVSIPLSERRIDILFIAFFYTELELHHLLRRG